MAPERKIIHDIRNCLNSLLLNSGYLEAFSPGEVAEAMEAIESTADQMCHLFDQLDALQINLQPQPHDIVPPRMLPHIPPEAAGDLDSTLNPKG